MTNDCAVLVTDNPLDYALAAAACEAIKNSEGLRSCYPIQGSDETLRLLEPMIAHYGARVIRFSDHYQAADPASRSTLLQRRFYGDKGEGTAIQVSVHAAPEALACGVMAAVAGRLPLVFTESDASIDHAVDEADGAGQEHVVFVRRRSPLAIAAAFYAASAHKRLLFADDVNQIPDSAEFSSARTAIIVDEFSSFTKPFLQKLTQWKTGGSAGILTAYSPETFTNLIWRILQYRDFQQSGRRAPLLHYFERPPLGTVEPVRCAVLNEHGNESHMHFGGEVLCGALAQELRPKGKPGFNCEWACPHHDRHSAAELAAHHLSILSCSTFTLGDGLVPPEFSLLLNLLNGWPVSIIAPWQHAITTPVFSVLTDALMHSGLTLAEITRSLNSVAAFGSYPHPAYALLGDPQTVIGQAVFSPWKVKETSLEDGIQVEFSNVHGRILRYPLPGDFSRTLLQNGDRPEVSPLSDSAKSAGIYFCFTGENGSPATHLLLFSDNELPGSVSLRIGVARRISAQERQSVLEAVERVHTHRIFGVEAGLLAKLEDSVLSLLRSQSRYPWLVERLVPRENGAWTEALDRRLVEVRHILMGDLLRRSADRLWVSHYYSRHYPQGRHLAASELSRVCHVCGNETHCWRYEDPGSGLDSRNMVMCSRCGIVADEPAEREIEIQMPPAAALEGNSHRQRLVIHNKSARPVKLSFFVQFHHWKSLGIESRNSIADVLIEPHGFYETEVTLDFARPLPDYIHDLMVYVLTDRLDLYNAGQKVASQQHGLFAMEEDERHKHGSHTHRQHAHAGHAAPQHHPGHAPHHAHDADRHAGNGTQPAAGRKPPVDDRRRFIVIVEPHGALYRYLQIAHRNFRTLVLTTNTASCLSRERRYNLSLGRPNATEIDRIIQCDSTNPVAMRKALEPWKDQIAGVVAGEDVFVSVSAALGRSLGFDYATQEDAVSHHLKSAMKRRFYQHGVPTPRFFITRNFEEARQAWDELNHDCMIKMVDFASSLNVFHATTFAEFEQAWDIIANNRRELKTLFPLSQEIVLEEFVEGRELSIEGYTQGDRIVCLNFSEKMTESSFVVVGHLLPALLSPEEERVLRHVAEQCVRATKMRNSVFHIEVHLKNGCPYVIECASRPPGQHMVELMHQSYGFDLMEISLALATGQQVLEQGGEPKKHFAMLALYSQEEGTFERLEGIEEMERHGGLVHVNVEVQPGARIEPLSTFRQKCGFAILEDSTAEGIRKKERLFRRIVRVGLAPKTAEAASPAGAAR